MESEYLRHNFSLLKHFNNTMFKPFTVKFSKTERTISQFHFNKATHLSELYSLPFQAVKPTDPNRIFL